MLPFIEIIILTCILLCVLIPFNGITYLPNDHFCCSTFTNIPSILSTAFIVYIGPFCCILFIYIHITRFIHHQGNIQTLVIKQRQSRDLIIIRRILIIINLLLIFGIPSMVLIFMFIITGEENPLLARISLFPGSVSGAVLSVALLFCIPQLKNIVLNLRTTNTVMPVNQTMRVAFITFIVQNKSQICKNTTQYGECSTNSACGYFHVIGAHNDTGICGFRWLACSHLVLCNSSDYSCSQPNTTCVQHPQCNDLPVCYPLTMTDQSICPPMKNKINHKWKQNAITVAGGNGLGQELNQLKYPHGIFIDQKKNIFIADSGNHRIVEWKYNAEEGQIIAGGNGQGNQMNQLNYSSAVIVDQQNHSIIVADRWNRRVIQWAISMGSGPVRSEPANTYHFENTFAPLSGERVIKVYECNEGCSSCCGPKTKIALTDRRIIARHQQPGKCCGEGAHIDTSIFLRDIELIGEAGQGKQDSCLVLLVAILSCTWPCLLCGMCCSCCGDRPKVLHVKGGFGGEALTFKNTELKTAANDLSAMILPFKSS
ncbi:unnamed protein product [Adineta steineri]|uniref:Uncharacterized protein n=1 Tax=Adineta steineri TaxID=433720 RepID=A0A814J6E2_9BILA|nr:unnamed protein product [Adineta steineri]CAF1069056.1 unnamed protein product [Adineta steineri]